MARLEILSGKRQGTIVELTDDEIDIGNRKTARLSIRDPWISWNHARIVSEGGKFFIEDLGSSNGTWINGEKITRQALTPNDVIYLGKTKVKFTGDPGVSADADAPVGAAADLQRALLEERRMRQALEKFLDLPAGARMGDVAKAGALERQVEDLEGEVALLRKRLAEADARKSDPAAVEKAVDEARDKLRREHMSKVVELEERASQAEAKVVDLERMLKEKAEQGKKELARARERAGEEAEDLRRQLEEARKAADDLARGGDTALKGERERAERLEGELDEARQQAHGLQDQLTTLQGELQAARSALAAAEERARAAEERARGAEERAAADSGGGADPAELEGLRAELEQAREEAARWQSEHARVVQEIDEISMEQIEIEEQLNTRIAELEGQLAERDA